MTIAELKEKKHELEREIYHLIKNFEHKYDITVKQVKYYEDGEGKDYVEISLDTGL